MAAQLSEGQQAVLLRSATDQIRGLFTNHPLWELERILGNGAYGVTALLRDRGHLKFGRFKWEVRKHMKVVLKRAIYRQAGIQDFQAEIIGLNRVRGLAHHVQSIATTLNTAAYRSASRRGVRDVLRNLLRPFQNPPTNIFTILGPFEGPALLLEYIENGSFMSFITKIWEDQIQLPNRLLWRFYLCLLKGVCGLVFQQRIPVQTPVDPLVIEEIPNNPTRTEFVHGDIAVRNIMFGGYNPELDEHALTPTLKFIDYGLSSFAASHEAAVNQNLWEVNKLMLYLINHHSYQLSFLPNEAVLYKGVYTLAASLIRAKDFDPSPHLDVQLRDLLCESFRLNERLRPSLEETLIRVENGVAKRASAYANREVEESDMMVTTYLQQLLHNAA